jgi:hypothetical protein
VTAVLEESNPGVQALQTPTSPNIFHATVHKRTFLVAELLHTYCAQKSLTDL